MGSNGTYAELISVPAGILATKPRNLSFAQAAAVPVVGLTALQTLRQTRIRPKDRVFVAGGAGGVGTMVLKLAQHYGLRHVFTTAGSATSFTQLHGLRLAPEQIVDYRAPDVAATLLARAGQPFGVVVDCVGLAASDIGASVLAVGERYADIAFLATESARERLFDKAATLHNISIYARSLPGRPADLRSFGRQLNVLRELFERNALTPAPSRVVGPLAVETVREAHQLLEANAGKGKLVMTMD